MKENLKFKSLTFEILEAGTAAKKGKLYNSRVQPQTSNIKRRTFNSSNIRPNAVIAKSVTGSQERRKSQESLKDGKSERRGTKKKSGNYSMSE
jgi:hypothetical protein